MHLQTLPPMQAVASNDNKDKPARKHAADNATSEQRKFMDSLKMMQINFIDLLTAPKNVFPLPPQVQRM
jgi:hypothetical protein